MTTDARSNVYRITGFDTVPPGSVDDDRLHEALNRVEEDALHRAARSLEARLNTMMRAVGPGAVWVISEIDPYVKIDAFDPELDEIHPRETYPACAVCDTGAEHWHRRADNTPVTWNPYKED